MARYANKQNLMTLVETLRGEYQTPSWVKQAEELGDSMSIIDGALSVVAAKESDGSQVGPILSLSAKGWAEQDTTTGKNLLPNRMSDGTVNGITFTKNADGSVRATGTMTKRANRWLVFTESPLVLSAGTYTLSDAKTGTFTNVWLELHSTGDAYLNTKSGAKTFTLEEESRFEVYVSVDQSSAVDVTFYPQLELGSVATPYEPYTGGAPSPSPDYMQEIRVCKGRNLFGSPFNGTLAGDASVSININNGGTSFKAEIDENTTYTAASFTAGTRFRVILFKTEPLSSGNTNVKELRTTVETTETLTFTFNSGDYKWVVITLHNANYMADAKVQLERGFVAHPYVPYGYVGMEVASPQSLYRDNYTINANGVLSPAPNNESWHVLSFPLTQQNFKFCYTKTVSAATNTRVHAFDSNGAWIRQVGYSGGQGTGDRVVECVAPSNATEIRVSIRKEYTDTKLVYPTTPIPLPSRGWVASLPDGTADTLTLDGAGKVTWTLPTSETTQAVTDGVTGTVGVDVLSTTGQIADGATVLYKLALDIPATEEWGGRVEMPEIPVNASISIPELDDLGVDYIIPLPVVLQGYEDRIAALEAAIAELATS